MKTVLGFQVVVCRDSSVPGVDVLLVSPSDLGNSIGHPILDGVIRDNPTKAINHILEAARKNGKYVCMYCASGPESKSWLERGYHMMRLPAPSFPGKLLINSGIGDIGRYSSISARGAS